MCWQVPDSSPSRGAQGLGGEAVRAGPAPSPGQPACAPRACPLTPPQVGSGLTLDVCVP